MNKEETWFREASRNTESRSISTPTGKHVFYKGFKLSNIEGNYTVVDVRMTDFYNKISREDLEMLDKHGFIKGADLLMYARDITRVATYTGMVERFTRMKVGFEGKLSQKQSESFAEKRIRNCETNLELLDELMSFYSTRLSNTKIKYKI